MIELSRKQETWLVFVSDFAKREGWAPTNREMCDRFGWASSQAAAYAVGILCRKGVLQKAPKSPRALRVTEEGKRYLANLWWKATAAADPKAAVMLARNSLYSKAERLLRGAK